MADNTAIAYAGSLELQKVYRNDAEVLAAMAGSASDPSETLRLTGKAKAVKAAEKIVGDALRNFTTDNELFKEVIDNLLKEDREARYRTYGMTEEDTELLGYLDGIQLSVEKALRERRYI